MERGAGPLPADFVQSVGRAMLILEMVGRRPGLPVKAIARRCSLNISTTYHLIRTLAYEGYLVRLPDGTYVIGDAVARRFHDLVTSLERPPDAAVVLHQLTERIGLSTYLGLLRDERVTVVEVAERARGRSPKALPKTGSTITAAIRRPSFSKIRWVISMSLKGSVRT